MAYPRRGFDPNVTEKGTQLPLMDLKGKPYLQVAYRIVWFREVHPNGVILTEPVQISEKEAIFKATIAILNPTTGQRDVIATGFKRETPDSFPDNIEKAETGAIGRALALAGFGTQFETGFDEGERLADAPVELIAKGKSNENSTYAQGKSALPPSGGQTGRSSPGPATTNGATNNQPVSLSTTPVNSTPAPSVASDDKPGRKKTALVEKAKTRGDVDNLLSSVSRSIIAKKLLTLDQIKGHMAKTYGSDDKAKLDDKQATDLLAYLDGLNNGMSNGASATA